MVTLTCTVRDCGRPLFREGGRMACERGHSFDVARRGYVNLLQPQDKKSAEPGDAKAVVAARGRFLARHGEPLALAIVDLARDACEGAAVLDVGCGEGFVLRAIRERHGVEAHGVDISVAAIEAAARSDPFASFVVANADRRLPYADGGFDLVLSITSRRPSAELRRVLAPTGVLVVAVPGGDDLVELREIVGGARVVEDRLPAALAELAPDFTALERREARVVARLEPDEIADALAMTYRGARRKERERAAALGAMDVTLAWHLARLAPRT